jgi:hypothetical protein
LRRLWLEAAMEIRKNTGTEEGLGAELMRQKLVSRPVSSSQSLALNRKREREIVKKERKKSIRTSNQANYHNAHLRGTEMERIVREAEALLEQNK